MSYQSFNLGGFAEAFRHRGPAYDRPFYGDGGLTPPVGTWAGPGEKLLAAICRVEDEAFNMAAIRPGLLQAVNRMRNAGRQVFDCRLGPGGVYHPERVQA